MEPSGRKIIKLLERYNILKAEDVEYLHVNFSLESLHQLEVSEDKHFWHKNRKYLIKKLITEYSDSNFTGVDIGCGNGSVIKSMKEYFPESSWTGIDGHLQGLINARKRTPTSILEWQDITKLSNVSGVKYDVALILDVLEHIDEPHKVLQTLLPQLNDEGRIIATVPADQKLWSNRDEFLGHRKRYSTDDLRQLFESNGYEVIKSNYCFSHLYLPAFLFRKILSTSNTGKQVEEEELKVRPLINPAMTSLGKLEMKFSLNFKLPIGTSAWCIAKKKL